jgi:RNA-directed DNA polymerase
LQREDGGLVDRDRGTPQGSAISSLLANMFLHNAFDAWIARKYRGVRFERYGDDVTVHASSERQARVLRVAVAQRLADCGLELNEHKTHIVYCKDSDRRGSHEHESFTFLGYTFRPRLARSKRAGAFVSFLPAIGNDEHKRIGPVIRRWRVACRSGSTLTDLAKAINAEVRGWSGSTARRRCQPCG